MIGWRRSNERRRLVSIPTDSLTASGVIALQVHGVGNNKQKEGIQVRWRNIKIDDLTP